MSVYSSYEKLEPFRGNGTKKCHSSLVLREHKVLLFPRIVQKKEKKKHKQSEPPPSPYSRKIAVQSTVLSLGAISSLFAMGIGGGKLLGVSIFQRGRGLGDVEFMRWCQILLYGGDTVFPSRKWPPGEIGRSGREEEFIYFLLLPGKGNVARNLLEWKSYRKFLRKYKDLLLACPNARFAFPISQQFGFFYFSADLNLLLRGKCRSLNPAAACHWAKNLLWDSEDTFQITVSLPPPSPL